MLREARGTIEGMAKAAHDVAGIVGKPRTADKEFSAKPHCEPAERNQLGQFVKGAYRGGPGRRPGSKNRIAEDLISAFADDFAEHGAAAIQRVREEQPAAYLKLAIELLPRDYDISIDIGMKVATDAAQAFALLSKLPKQELLELKANVEPTD